MDDLVNLAWAAGFIDGEASISVMSKTRKPRILLSVTQVEPEALHRIAKLTGNKVSGPHSPPSHKGQPYYTTRIAGSNATKLIISLWPYLTKATKSKYTQAKLKVEELNRNPIY